MPSVVAPISSRLACEQVARVDGCCCSQFVSSVFIVSVFTAATQLKVRHASRFIHRQQLRLQVLVEGQYFMPHNAAQQDGQALAPRQLPAASYAALLVTSKSVCGQRHVFRLVLCDDHRLFRELNRSHNVEPITQADDREPLTRLGCSVPSAAEFVVSRLHCSVCGFA